MSRKRIYQPSETHLKLYPPSTRILCPCGVRFTPRLEAIDDEDDLSLCLTCNRSRWSRLWNGNRPIEIATQPETSTVDFHDLDEINAHDLAFNLDNSNDDTDIGEVVSMIERRPRR